MYIQSTTLLNRDFYVCPPPELLDILQLSNNTIIKVIKPLYSIPEASNHWFLMYHLHYTEKLKIKESTYNLCLFYTHKARIGIISLQTDDTLFIGDKEFAQNKEINLINTKFMAKEYKKLTTSTPIKFNGGQITLNNDNSITFNQIRQYENLNLVNLKTINLMSLRGTKRVVVTPKD